MIETTKRMAGGHPDAAPAPGGTGEPPDAPSPFERTPRRGLRRLLAFTVWGLVLAGAVAVAWVATRDRTVATMPAGHNHAAMAAGAPAGPVALGADAARRIGVTWAAVTEGPLSTEVRTVGQVTYDETRVQAVAPKIDGWVERLFIDFTGQAVQAGAPLFSIYSPMLVSAQEELLLAVRLQRDVANGTPEARRSADDLLASARRRLLYWDVPESEIERIQRSGQVSKTLTLRAAVTGIVIDKPVLAGQRIMAGQSVYRVADLGTIWVEGEIFERDLGLVRLGASVVVDVQAYPGAPWHGTVTYVYPTVDPSTRTARIRVALANPGLRLKPGMYATIRVRGSRGNRVLSIPRSAALASGDRTIAFVRLADGRLAPREIVTGVATIDRVEVMRGLAAGDTVVASATFLIDAESNLGAAMGAMAGMPGMDMGAPLDKPATQPADMPGMDMPGTSAPGTTMPGMNMPATSPPPKRGDKPE